MNGLINFRDIAASDSRIKAGLVFRSADLTLAGASGLDTLRSERIELIIDLRRTAEVEMFGRGPSQLRRMSIDLIPEGVLAEPYEFDSWADYFHAALVDPRVGFNIARVLTVIAEAREPVLVHCSAGKDRTGLVIALLLAVVGTDSEAIARDYAMSEGFMRGLYAEWARNPLSNIESLTAAHPMLLEASESTVKNVLRTLRNEQGSTQSYLQQIGLDSAIRERLMQKMLINDSP